MQYGRIHNNVIPLSEHEGIQGHNASSRHDLELHNEVASFNINESFDASPDFVSLHFFRNERFLPAVVADFDITELDPLVVDILSSVWFKNITSPGQGGIRNNVDEPVSILYGSKNIHINNT